ncbi:CLUMA_CG007393, isoform A [Clunio marinus]|uniref:CLUMA_CG007393, isoform A n=1 Tax=Clunio marinus TaxID=568069 RepID=A0A1J1I275_9DIPT|nr:CLUMA_CG007393, isoform A [Clunio marinus]
MDESNDDLQKKRKTIVVVHHQSKAEQSKAETSSRCGERISQKLSSEERNSSKFQDRNYKKKALLRKLRSRILFHERVKREDVDQRRTKRHFNVLRVFNL